MLVVFLLFLCGCVPMEKTEADGSAALDISRTDTTTEEKKPQLSTPNASGTLVLNKNSSFQSLYASQKKNEELIIKGGKSGIKLTLPSAIYLKGDLKLDNVTLVGSNTKIYANGYRLVISRTVKTSSRNDRLTVYGGGSQTVSGDTYLELLGGRYRAVYGGGANAAVMGDTCVIFGGNANFDDSADDASSDFFPCCIYGGGSNGSVGGIAKVTVRGSAVAAYVCGAGTGSNGANVKKVNIQIQGGKLMNVYGGSLDSAMTNVQVQITVTGGLTEAIFGGCHGKNLSGSVDIKLLGGEITRRLYTGCYNNCDVGFFSDTWTTDGRVTGSTGLTISKDAQLCTGTALSSENTADMGIFSGSRHENRFSEETNLIIFLDGCYSEMISQIGPSSKSYWDLCKSRHSYIYDCSVGGKVTLAEDGTAVRIAPGQNYKATYGGVTYLYSADQGANQVKLGEVLSSPKIVKIVFQHI